MLANRTQNKSYCGEAVNMVVVALSSMRLLVLAANIAERLSIRLAIHRPATAHIKKSATQWISARITDAYSRVRETLAYSSNKVSTFMDMASHVITLGYTSGKLTGVTLTDPDGGGALSAPVWSYACNSTTGLLEKQTDPNSVATIFSYNSTSLRLSSQSRAVSTYSLTPVQTYGLKTGSSNSLVETVNPLGFHSDPAAHEFRFQMDRFGKVLSYGFYSFGSSSDVTDTSRDPNGLPYIILQPAIGGIRYQTKLGYDDIGDVLKIINSDNTTQPFTYDSTFHNVLTATDEMSRVTTITYNA